MFKKSFIVAWICVISVFAFGVVVASADSDATGAPLTYSYYSIRDASNYVTMSSTTASCTTPLPTGRTVVTYTPVADPANDCTVSKSKPIGVGSVASGGDYLGNSLEIRVDTGPFAKPVNVSLGIFASSVEATDIFFLSTANQLASLQEEFDGASTVQGNFDQGHGSHGGGNMKPNFRKFILWKSNVLEVNQTVLGPIDTTQMPPGLYVLILNVTGTTTADDDFNDFYRWVTFFIVPNH